MWLSSLKSRAVTRQHVDINVSERGSPFSVRDTSERVRVPEITKAKSRVQDVNLLANQIFLGRC